MLIFRALIVIHLNRVPVLAHLSPASSTFTASQSGPVVSASEHLAADEHSSGTSPLAFDLGQGWATERVSVNPSNSLELNHLPQQYQRPEHVGAIVHPPMTAGLAQYWPRGGYRDRQDFSSHGFSGCNYVLNDKLSEDADTSGANVGLHYPYDHGPTGGYNQHSNAPPNQGWLMPRRTFEPTTASTSMKPWPEYYAPNPFDAQSSQSAAKEYTSQPTMVDFTSIGSSWQPSTSATHFERGDSPGGTASVMSAGKRRARLAFEQERRILGKYQAARSVPGFTRQVLEFDRVWLNRLSQNVDKVNEEKRAPWVNFLKVFQQLFKNSASHERAYLVEVQASEFFATQLRQFWQCGSKGKGADDEKADREVLSKGRNLEKDYRDISYALELPENIFKFGVDLGAEPFEKGLLGTFLLPYTLLSKEKVEDALQRRKFAQNIEMRRLFLAHVFLINNLIIDEPNGQHIGEMQGRAAAFFGSLGGLQTKREEAVAELTASGKLPKTQVMLTAYILDMEKTVVGWRRKFKNLWKLIQVWLEAERPNVLPSMISSPKLFRRFFTYTLMAELEVW